MERVFHRRCYQQVDFPKLCEESVLEEGVPDEDRDYQSFASV